MALGGGTYITQNKILPGSYVNVISKQNTSSTVSERGSAAIALEMDWGEESKIFSFTYSELVGESLRLFGHFYTSDELRGIRDIFKNADKVYVFRLNGNGTKAENSIATAKYSGLAGNNLKTVIEKNVDNDTEFCVKTYFYQTLVDTQTVTVASDLKDNAYVSFKKNAEMSVNAGMAFSGGKNGTAATEAHQSFLNALESCSVNAVGVVSEDYSLNKLYSEYAKRLRNEKGIRLQAVVFGKKDTDGSRVADSESVVTVQNSKEAVYWVLGVIAGTPVNKSALNKVYDGEFDIPADYTQTELEEALLNGEFVIHRVGDELRVLDDINSLVTFSSDKGEIFKDNQTVRVSDSIVGDISAVFISKYLGKIPNDVAGRESFRADIINILSEMRALRAIDEFDESEISVEAGTAKNSIVVSSAVTVIGTMAKLYMTCVIE